MGDISVRGLSALKTIGYKLGVYTPSEKEFEMLAENQCLTNEEAESLLYRIDKLSPERLFTIYRILEAFPKGTKISVSTSSEGYLTSFSGKVVGIRGNEIDGISLCTYDHYNYGFKEVEIDPEVYGPNFSFERPEEGIFSISSKLQKIQISRIR